jgi:hypothetical protein
MFIQTAVETPEKTITQQQTQQLNDLIERGRIIFSDHTYRRKFEVNSSPHKEILTFLLFIFLITFVSLSGNFETRRRPVAWILRRPSCETSHRNDTTFVAGHFIF